MSAHVQEQLSAFMDGELNAAEHSEVREHLRHCASCARRLEELSTIDEAARALPLEAPPGYFDTFAGRVRDRLEGERPAARARTVPRWTWALAAGILLAVVTPLTVRRFQESPPVGEEFARHDPLGGERQRALAPAPAARVPAPAPEPADSPASLEARATPAGTLGKLKAPERPLEPPKKDAASGAPARNAAGASLEQLARAEEATKRPAPALAGGSKEVKAQAAPSTFQEDRLALRDQPRPGAPPPAQGREGERDESVRKAEASPETAIADAAGEASNIAPAPGAVAPSGAGVRRRVTEKARPSESVVAPAPGLRAEYERLKQRTATDLEAARTLREAWRSFGLRNSESPYADEARVATIAAGAEAVRLGGDPADRELLERDAAGYLERDESRQKERVREILRRTRP